MIMLIVDIVVVYVSNNSVVVNDLLMLIFNVYGVFSVFVGFVFVVFEVK